jgi:hypothetical protein
MDIQPEAICGAAPYDHSVSRRSERIEDYLDHLCAPLVGLVPYAERIALRSEAGAHIAWLIDEFEHQGLERPEAVEAALHEHGEPWAIGVAWVDEWLRGAPNSSLSRRVGSGGMRAFVAFGAASVLNWLLMEACLLLPAWSFITPWLPLIVVLSPIVAGGLTGATAPSRVVHVVCGVQLILTAHSFLCAWTMWPRQEAVYFALFQLVFWLPVGCLSAWCAAMLARHLRRTRFCRTTWFAAVPGSITR